SPSQVRPPVQRLKTAPVSESDPATERQEPVSPSQVRPPVQRLKTAPVSESNPATERQTVTPKEECRNEGKYWNIGANKCCPNDKRLVHNGQCVSLKEKKCVTSGGSWDGRSCVCPSDKPQLLNGRCQACPSDRPRFSGGQCRPCLGNTNWNGQECVAEEQAMTAKERCEEEGKYWNTGANKCCPNDKRLVHNGQCVSLKEKKCVTSGGSWDGRSCSCPQAMKMENGNCREKTEKDHCEEKGSGWTWRNGRCVKTAEQMCKDKPGNWRWSGTACLCPRGHKESGDRCIRKTERDYCEDKGANWRWIGGGPSGKCVCPLPYKVEDGNCREKAEKDHCEEKGSGWTWKNGKCVECPEWKKHSAFKPNGKVSSSFCDKYASDKRSCKRALSYLQRRAKQLERLRDQLDKLEDKLLKAQFSDKKESTTEASGLCFDCLKRVIRASQPSTGQVIGNSLKLLAGAGLSVAGYNVGKSAQNHANMMRIQQGYPSQYDSFALTGMTAGFPFAANGLYGLARTNTPVGGWACSPSVSPYGHVYNHGYGYGHNRGY
ncbi:MAG: hypothetical protein OXN83_02240, partial [Oligoflexia bacterium]|nr:hypothetical protein [Oligoflexia bacterium]